MTGAIIAAMTNATIDVNSGIPCVITITKNIDRIIVITQRHTASV